VAPSILFSSHHCGTDPERIPEDYYSYLEGWYRSQVKGSHVAAAAAKSGSLPSLHTGVPTSFPYLATTASASQLTVTVSSSAGGGQHPGLFIPVTALQGLRSSLPGQLPQLTSGKCACQKCCSFLCAVPAPGHKLLRCRFLFYLLHTIFYLFRKN
jgi:hypothetical protein